MNHVVLVLTADSADAQQLRQCLAEARDGPFDVIVANTLAQALYKADNTHIDAVLADLDLPDSQGLATFDQIAKALPTVPVLTLSSTDDETDAIAAIQRGAQGFLSKGYFRNALVPQAIRSMIHRRAVEEALYVEKERSRIILEAIGEGVISTDLDGKVTYLNPVAETMTGWDRDSAASMPFEEVACVVDANNHQPVWEHLKAAVLDDKPVQGVAGMLLKRRDGHELAVDLSVGPVNDGASKLSGTVVVLHDASASQADTVRKLTYLAEHDFLTDLPNRFLLNDRINQAISRASRDGTQLAVLFLDLDNFKHVNDSLGHAIGDKLLQAVAGRLRASVRHSDTVSRQGGDEFIIVTSDERSPTNVAHTAEKLLGEVAVAHRVDGHVLQVTTSIGISVFPEDGDNADTLLKNADTAMYHAKNHGRDNYQFFNSDMNARAIERQSLEANLRNALQRKEFALHYQPKVDLRSGAITGCEALLRWHHAQRGWMLPNHFVAIAEDCGMITPIGHWVLNEACRQVRQWQKDGVTIGSIAVNVSASEFRSRGFLDGVRAVLSETQIDPRCLELELTESVLMHDVESSRAILRALKELGVRIVVDDFGTGYSSLSYLKQFPIDVLKIDQSFVIGVESDTDNGIIVTAVVGMGRNLKMNVIAEGIETREQCHFLQSRHCHEGQGYYFSAPLAPEQFVSFVRKGINPADLS
jgi:diguanylate cyclase (GGDEF)-like protein/PAS domain S-box-containing protein